MNHKSIILTLMTLFIMTKVNAQRGKIVGGRTEIKDVTKNKEVQDLGRFSVEEYNRRLQENEGRRRESAMALRFVEVEEAERQVVAGVKYYLKVAAMRDWVKEKYDAVVVVKPWFKSKELLNFVSSSS